jgi:hypothetical protein
MATEKQRTAAKRNVKKAQAGAKRKQTLMNLPSETGSAPGREAATARRGDAPTATSSCSRPAAFDIRGCSKIGKKGVQARRRPRKWRLNLCTGSAPEPPYRILSGVRSVGYVGRRDGDLWSRKSEDEHDAQEC